MTNKIIFDEFIERKIINNITSLDKFQNAIKNHAYVYCGFDPTAKSLHLGNYAQIIGLKLLEQLGLKIICILGTGTGLIGDPSFKNSERILLDKKTFEVNKESIENQLKKFFFNNDSLILGNNDWYKNKNIIDFLRDIGKYINISQMIHKENVARRIETGISFTEFSYQILQAWDFYYLYKNYKCWVQLGGSDQWGNITGGSELIRKIVGDANNFSVGLTLNLLTNEKKEKFGKSVDGAIFLDKNLTSPYKMYQFLYNQPDSMLKDLFCMLTLKPLVEIKSILNDHQKQPHLRIGQIELANEIVKTIHGEATLKIVLAISKHLHKSIPSELSNEDLNNLFENIDVVKEPFNLETTNIKTFLLNSKIFSSNRELTEFFNSKSIKINGEKIHSLDNALASLNYLQNKYLIIQKGKHLFWIYKK